MNNLYTYELTPFTTSENKFHFHKYCIKIISLLQGQLHGFKQFSEQIIFLASQLEAELCWISLSTWLFYLTRSSMSCLFELVAVMSHCKAK